MACVIIIEQNIKKKNAHSKLCLPAHKKKNVDVCDGSGVYV